MGGGTKRIYIAGNVTGDNNYWAKFHAEAERLRAMGHFLVNPAEIVAEDEPWESAMRTVLQSMLTCDGVSLLPDWLDSRGVKIEERIAREVGMEVRDCRDWKAIPKGLV